MTATEPLRAPARPTMRDVAALSGVSIKTVSRVINAEPGVSPDLTERVQAAAQALAYQPNLTASSLRRSDGKTRTIGLLLENVANPYESALHRRIEDIARERGVTVFAGSLDEDAARERELAIDFISRRVDGLIVMPAGGSDHSYLASERRSGTPMVFVDRPPMHLDADTVLVDNEAGARTAVDHLLAHGHRRIAYLGDLSTLSTAVERLTGYRDALERAGIPYDGALVRQDLRSSDSAAEAVADLLELSQPPTAIFAAQNLMTIGAVRALHRAAQQHRIALVGFDDVPLVDLLDPAVTTINQDVEGIATAAAELLFRRLDGDAGRSEHHIIPTTIVVRGSGEIPATLGPGFRTGDA